jgi:hypothetical protein
MSGECKHKGKLQMYKSIGTGNQGQTFKEIHGQLSEQMT